MPRIQVKLIDEVFAPAQKKAAIAELTRAIVAVQGKQPVTLVVIEEDSSEGSEPLRWNGPPTGLNTRVL